MIQQILTKIGEECFLAARTAEDGRALSTAVNRVQIKTLTAFVKEVNRRAEVNMLKTGKLEGSHHAAIRKLCEDLKIAVKLDVPGRFESTFAPETPAETVPIVHTQPEPETTAEPEPEPMPEIEPAAPARRWRPPKAERSDV